MVEMSKEMTKVEREETANDEVAEEVDEERENGKATDARRPATRPADSVPLQTSTNNKPRCSKKKRGRDNRTIRQHPPPPICAESADTDGRETVMADPVSQQECSTPQPPRKRMRKEQTRSKFELHRVEVHIEPVGLAIEKTRVVKDQLMRADDEEELMVPVAPDEAQTTRSRGDSLVGATVVVDPDEKGREADRAAGYKLGLNLGQVVASADQQVQLWWWFGSKKWTDDWCKWRFPGTNERYTDWVPVQDLCRSTSESRDVLRVEMTDGRKSGWHKITKRSLKELDALRKEGRKGK